MGTLSPQTASEVIAWIERLSYSLIDLLVDIYDDTKRNFSEFECIEGNWSVRELKMQPQNLKTVRYRMNSN